MASEVLMGQVFVRGLSLPGKIRGVTIFAPDDDFVVFINTDLCKATQRKALDHEMHHIRMNHFYNEDPVVINEMEAGIL